MFSGLLHSKNTNSFINSINFNLEPLMNYDSVDVPLHIPSYSFNFILPIFSFLVVQMHLSLS